MFLSLVQGWFSVGLRYVLRGWVNLRLVYGWFRVDSVGSGLV